MECVCLILFCGILRIVISAINSDLIRAFIVFLLRQLIKTLESCKLYSGSLGAQTLQLVIVKIRIYLSFLFSI